MSRDRLRAVLALEDCPGAKTALMLLDRLEAMEQLNQRLLEALANAETGDPATRARVLVKAYFGDKPSTMKHGEA